MTIKELIEQLKAIKNQDRIVIMAKDAEGNQFSPLCDVSTDVNYQPYNTWSGEVGLEELTEEHKEAGYGEEDVVEGESCLVLWPTN